MKILSLFNGISGLHCAFDRAGIKVDTCYYSEIDKYANMVTEKHYPNDIALGDVTKWKEWNIDWASIDFVSAGFPCQAWSVAGNQLGDKDERGALFWTTLDVIANVLKHNPNAKFLMENVKMKKDFEQYITHHTEQALGYVEKTLINSALVSAQNRNRYYWTNFKVTQPDDKGILLRDIVENLEFNEVMPSNVEFKDNYAQWDVNNKGNKSQDQRAFYIDGKHGTIPANGGGSKVKVCGGVLGDKSQTILSTIYKENAKSMVKRNKFGLCVPDTNKTEYVEKGIHYRKLTPLECERLQTLPDNWTDCISNTQRYKSIGNGWTIDVIAHILKCVF